MFLVSLTGVPVSAGFVGKFYLFDAAVKAGWVALALVGVVMSVVSAYYYLRVVVAMYMNEPVGDDDWSPVSPAAALALAVSVGLALLLGVCRRRCSPSPASPPAAWCSSSSSRGLAFRDPVRRGIRRRSNHSGSLTARSGPRPDFACGGSP